MAAGAQRCLQSSQLLPRAARTLLAALPGTAGKENSNWHSPVPVLLRGVTLEHKLPCCSVPWPEPAAYGDSGTRGPRRRAAGGLGQCRGPAEPPALGCCFTLRRGIASPQRRLRGRAVGKAAQLRAAAGEPPPGNPPAPPVNSLLQNPLLAVGRGLRKRLLRSKHELGFLFSGSRAHGEAAGGGVGCMLWGHCVSEGQRWHRAAPAPCWRARGTPAKGSAHSTRHTPSSRGGGRETHNPHHPAARPKARAPSCPHRASDRRSLLLRCSD